MQGFCTPSEGLSSPTTSGQLSEVRDQEGCRPLLQVKHACVQMKSLHFRTRHAFCFQEKGNLHAKVEVARVPATRAKGLAFDGAWKRSCRGTGDGVRLEFRVLPYFQHHVVTVAVCWIGKSVATRLPRLV